MTQAWKRPDGRYELFRFGPDGVDLRPLVVDEDDLEDFGAEKVFGVVTGPSSCGCEPAMFRWVGEKEVEAGRTEEKACLDCSSFGVARGTAIFSRCDIIDVCGEPDVARAVYEAEFADKIAHLAGEPR